MSSQPAAAGSSAPTDRDQIGRLVATKLRKISDRLKAEWNDSKPVRHFVVDDLLPEAGASALYAAMPAPESLMFKNSLRERKRVGVDVDRYHPSVGAHLFAFQHPEVIAAVAEITGVKELEADPSLYASGISIMERGHYLSPHIDNSHDGEQQLYRVLNLLYYVTPGWGEDTGGNLELWEPDLRQPIPVPSKFNRLVVMETNPKSWHSVNPIKVDGRRVCVSNYYFSRQSPTGIPYRNVTFFRGRPEEPLRRALLQLDSSLLNFIGKTFPALVKANRHRRKPGDDD